MILSVLCLFYDTINIHKYNRFQIHHHENDHSFISNNLT